MKCLSLSLAMVLAAGTIFSVSAGTYELSSATFALDAAPLDSDHYRGLSSYKVVDLSGTIFRSSTYEIHPIYEDAQQPTAISANFVLYE